MNRPIGFSWTGVAFLLCLLAPNLLWTRYRPRGYDPSGESRLLLMLERVGQVWVTCAALLFQDPGFQPWTSWSWWLAGAAALMILYELWWLRYFRSRRTMADFTASFLAVPVAGAALPVLAFFLLGIYRRSIWMLAGVVILGAGHIGIHLCRRAEVRKDQTYE